MYHGNYLHWKKLTTEEYSYHKRKDKLQMLLEFCFSLMGKNFLQNPWTACTVVNVRKQFQFKVIHAPLQNTATQIDCHEGFDAQKMR